MISEYDRAREVLLDHYVQLNLDGKISEKEMEKRMDKLDVLEYYKVVEMYRRLKRRK